jgi:hypothetical protein
MNGGDRHKAGLPCIKVEVGFPQSDVLFLRGEELLDRAHEVAHEIEEHVRQVLEEGESPAPSRGAPGMCLN